MRTRTSNRIALAATLVGAGALGVAYSNSANEDIGTLVLDDLSDWGFAGEAALAGLGLILLAFLAGAARRVVAAATLGVIVLVNLTMAVPSNDLTMYPTQPGTDRNTMLELAENSPNLTIRGEMPAILRIGEVLGEAALIVPTYELAGGLRAFTEVEAVVGGVHYQISPEALDSYEDKRTIGRAGTRDVVLVGSDDVYYWVVSRDQAVVIIAEELFDGVNS